MVAAGRVLSLLGEFPDGPCTIMVVKDDLVFNNTLFREAGMHGDKLVRLLGAKGLSRVDFLQGVSAGGDPRLFADVAATKAPRAATRTSASGASNWVRRRCRLAAPPPSSVDAAFHAEQLARVQAVYEQVSPFRELPIVGLEEVVTTFLLTFRRGANLLRMLSPVKTLQRAHLHARRQRFDPGHGAGRAPRPEGRVRAGDRHRGAAARRRQAADPQGDPPQARASSPTRSSGRSCSTPSTAPPTSPGWRG